MTNPLDPLDEPVREGMGNAGGLAGEADPVVDQAWEERPEVIEAGLDDTTAPGLPVDER